MTFLVLIRGIIAVIAFCAVGVSSQNVSTINVPLSKSLTWDDRELYSEFIKVNHSSTVRVKFSDVNKNISFIIFQVHSHLYNVTVYNNTLTPTSSVIGTNVGLYSSIDPIDSIFIYNQNKEVDLDLLMVVHGYVDEDPIPGGCNMEFPISISPFMKVTNEKDVIVIGAPPARSYKDFQCIQVKSLDFQFYMMYLPEKDLEAPTYYDGLKKMMTLKNIRENGERLIFTRWPMIRVLSAYPGTGAIYVAVATSNFNPNYYSVYIPTHSYGCSPLSESCEVIDDNFSKLICAVLMFVGAFMCYFGHRFFKTEMFLFGMLSGVVITYIVISLLASLDNSALISVSLLSGALFGAIWVTFWIYYGIPVIAVSLPALNMGFLIAAIMYNKFPGDLTLIQDDFNFWTLFIVVMILSTIMLVSVTFVSNILCCAVLGAYAVVYPLDFYIGSNLKYIIINTIRRATVDKFNRAILMPPFELRDAIIVGVWIALAVSGYLFQHYQNREKSPFPPPARSLRSLIPEQSVYGALPATRNVPSVNVVSPDGIPNERTSLLTNN